MLKELDMPSLGRDHPVVADLKYASYQDLPIQPLTEPVPPEVFRGGPVLGTDPLSMSLRHHRERSVSDGFSEFAIYNNRIDGEWNYAGIVYAHFGHFLAECVHRIIPTRRIFPCRNWLFVYHHYNDCAVSDFDSLPDYSQEILNFLEIGPHNFKMIHQNTKVEIANIVQQGSSFVVGPQPGYLRELRDFTDPRLDIIPTGRVYVSRTALPPGGSYLGEKYLENLLESEGFTVFHPEKYTFKRQMEMYRGSEVIIFAEGSACHGTELLGEGSLEKTILLTRRPHLSISFENILKPRSNEYYQFLDTEYLGCIISDRGWLGMSIMDWSKLLPFLYETANVKLEKFRPDEYISAARADLREYIEYHRLNSNMADESTVEELEAAAERAFERALQGIS